VGGEAARHQRKGRPPDEDFVPTNSGKGEEKEKAKKNAPEGQSNGVGLGQEEPRAPAISNHSREAMRGGAKDVNR